MLHGLLWFPLLGIFFGLAWAGWNEYQKVQGYSAWAAQYEKSKYDVYAALGFRSGELTWGKPLRKGLEDRQVMALNQVESVRLRVDGTIIDLSNPPSQGKVIALELLPIGPEIMMQIPFVNLETAVEWTKYLQTQVSRAA